MVKKILIAVGVVTIACILLFVGLLFWAQRAGADLQAKFFTAVESGDVKQVQALMHPGLREKVDEPVLAAWIAELRERLGAFQGLSKSEFQTSTRYEGGATITESEGSVNFELGTATSKLVFRDDLLVEFSVKSERIPDGWFKGPADSTLYRQRGEEFLRLLLGDEPKQAYDRMHEVLQKEMPLEKLKPTISDFVSKTGKLKSIAYTDEQFESSPGQRLKVWYKVECADAQVKGLVVFRFGGLKGHITAFDLEEEEE